MLEHWYEALASEHGIEIATNDPERLRQRLYSERRKAADPMLENLSISISPLNPGKLWIVKQ